MGLFKQLGLLSGGKYEHTHREGVQVAYLTTCSNSQVDLRYDSQFSRSFSWRLQLSSIVVDSHRKSGSCGVSSV